MELSLSLERLNYDKLLHLHAVLDKHADAQATHFAESMLEEQVRPQCESAACPACSFSSGPGHLGSGGPGPPARADTVWHRACPPGHSRAFGVFPREQVNDIKQTADYVAQLRRVGKGLGVWQFDHELYEGEVRYMANAGGEDANGA